MTRRKTSPFHMALGALGAGLMLAVLIVAHGFAAHVEHDGARPGAIDSAAQCAAPSADAHLG